MNPHVCLLVGWLICWLVGRSICFDFLKGQGKLHFQAFLERFLKIFILTLQKNNKKNIEIVQALRIVGELA